MGDASNDAGAFESIRGGSKEAAVVPAGSELNRSSSDRPALS